MLPHIIVGIALLVMLPVHWYVAHFGEPVTARIDNVQYETTKKGGYYRTNYHYTFQGRRFDESGNGNAHTRVGDTFPGRAGAFLDYTIFMSTSGNDLGGLTIAAVGWNSFMAVFVYFAWIIPVRQRRLVRYGEATPGVITKLWQTTGRGAAYHAQYEFTTRAGETLTSKHQPNAAAYQTAREGDNITVLYNPAKPKRNIPYELSDFRIDA